MSEPNALKIPSLDGIRAIAVVIVMLSHAGFTPVPGGMGVTIFFFLSGYLITTLMLAEYARTGTINIVKFYARRIFRLMPPLLITLAIAYGLTYFGWLLGGISLLGFASQVFYFANYYGIFFDPGNSVPDGTGILWSLAVEEHFYIFYPLFMAWLLQNKVSNRNIGLLAAAACILVLSWRIYLIQSPAFSSLRTYYASDTRIDSIMFGCILAFLANPMDDSRRGERMTSRQWALLAVALCTLTATFLYRDEAFREGIRYSIQGIALMPIFYLAIRYSDRQPFKILNRPFVRRLGIYSYAIYLIHYIIIRFVATNFPEIGAKPLQVFIIALLVATSFAAVVDHFVDPYFKRLRQQYQPGHAAEANLRP